jgi:hypothetical protein
VYLCGMTPAQQAEEAGFDLSLVDESLRLTPEQRLLQHQAALELMLAMERAGVELRERTAQPAAAP